VVVYFWTATNRHLRGVSWSIFAPPFIDCCGEIHLLLSDFQMPGMSGIELATQMSVDRPQLKVLMMSGFTEGMLVLNEGWHFLAKPFIPSQLRALVSGLLFPERSSRFSPSA
jgi:DNA-binding NtrC family response regulator